MPLSLWFISLAIPRDINCSKHMLATVYAFIETNEGNIMVIILMQVKCLHLHRNDQPMFR
jgi:hypothetical protein